MRQQNCQFCLSWQILLKKEIGGTPTPRQGACAPLDPPFFVQSTLMEQESPGFALPGEHAAQLRDLFAQQV